MRRRNEAARQAQAVREEILRRAEREAWRHGMSRRQFMESTMGIALTLTAINELGSALDTLTTESDLIKAADKFCDQANKFVDEFNANKDQFAESQIVKSMGDDPDSKKAMEDYMESLKSKLEDARPIFENLISSLSRHSDSREINRVRDRVAATFQRIQLLYM